MSWGSPSQDAWDTSAMDNSLPPTTAGDGEDWGNYDGFANDGGQGFGDSGGFSLGPSDAEPLHEDGCRR